MPSTGRTLTWSNGVLEGLAAWVERCPCHDPLQPNCRSRVPSHVQKEEFGDGNSLHGLSCPLRGCRALELAAGEVSAMLDEAFATCCAQLALRWLHQLSND